MKRIRIVLAIMVAKAVLLLSRAAGNQGSVLPGHLARKIYPPILSELAAGIKKSTIIVTGTNGKTTTANILAHILKTESASLIHNRTGANMLAGITTAFIDGANWYGGKAYDYALLETDEAHVPLLLQEIAADYLLITNFFRDQLDRFGELDHTVALIQAAVRGTSIELFLNADDPLISAFAKNSGCWVYYFGFAANAYDQKSSQESLEGKYCMVCGAPITYERFHYAQLGRFYCPQCGNRNPDIDYLATDLLMEPLVQLAVNGTPFQSNLQGYYNAYNLLAAVTVAQHLQVEPCSIAKAVNTFRPHAGRMERFLIGDQTCILTLVKNPAGFNQLLASLSNDDCDKVLVLVLNDNAADGRDVSWIWDVELENLVLENCRVKTVICSGQRSGDMALRVKYAGWPQDRLQLAATAKEALLLAVQEESRHIYIICTYTALFKTRKMLLHSFPAQKVPEISLASGGK